MSNAQSQPDPSGPSDTEGYEKDKVVKIINSVLEKTKQSNEETTSAIYLELQDLHNIIERARKELSGSGAGDISQKHIPTATDELDAIVESTAAATGGIMDACDVIQENVGKLSGEPADAITNEIMKIYEECSFQDITGQRITKIVKTLKTIEAKVDSIVKAISTSGGGGLADSTDGEDSRTGDAALLNGPQLPQDAVTQDDIDKLLKELDG